MYNHLKKILSIFDCFLFTKSFFIRYNFKIKNTMVVAKSFEEYFDNSLRLTS